VSNAYSSPQSGSGNDFTPSPPLAALYSEDIIHLAALRPAGLNIPLLQGGLGGPATIADI